MRKKMTKRKQSVKGPEAKYAAIIESQMFRVHDTMITSTIESRPAVIDFNDILACCRVEIDEDMGPPWKENDGWEHEAVRFDKVDESPAWEHVVETTLPGASKPVYGTVKHYNPEHIGGGHSRYNNYLILVTDEHLEQWGWGLKDCPYGTPRQVYMEQRAEVRRRTIEQLVTWYDQGWSWYRVVCDFLDYTASLWGIQTEDDDVDDPYLAEGKEEMAEEVSDQLEKDGYTVINKPSHAKTREYKHRELLWHICRNLGFKKPEHYRAWIEDRSVTWIESETGRRVTKSARAGSVPS